jgi:ABC-type transporter Mla subunit MlaD
MGRRVVWIAAVCLAMIGCNKKGPECESIVQVINPSVEKLSQMAEAPSDKPEDNAKQLQTMAKISASTAAELSKLTLTIPELQKFSTDYQSVSKDMSDATSSVADLITSLDKADPVAASDKLKAASDKMDAAEKRQVPLVEGLNKFCSSP